MSKKLKISATIVLYKNNHDIVKQTIDSFLDTTIENKKLYLVDNSPTNALKDKFEHPLIKYHFTGKNIGFGAGHNKVLEKIKNSSDYHLVLNPDVEFDVEVIPNLISAIENDKDVAMIAPKVVFPNGNYQSSCRRYPRAFELFARRLSFPKSIIRKGQYDDLDLSKSFYPDFLQGCFQLFKTEDFVKIGGFDERYFLYMEDVDICRKIEELGKKKLYYPDVQITHVLKKESSKNVRLFFTHLNSSFKYFKKWGF